MTFDIISLEIPYNTKGLNGIRRYLFIICTLCKYAHIMHPNRTMNEVKTINMKKTGDEQWHLTIMAHRSINYSNNYLEFDESVNYHCACTLAPTTIMVSNSSFWLMQNEQDKMETVLTTACIHSEWQICCWSTLRHLKFRSWILYLESISSLFILTVTTLKSPNTNELFYIIWHNLNIMHYIIVWVRIWIYRFWDHVTSVTYSYMNNAITLSPIAHINYYKNIRWITEYWIDNNYFYTSRENEINHNDGTTYWHCHFNLLFNNSKCNMHQPSTIECLSSSLSFLSKYVISFNIFHLSSFVLPLNKHYEIQW